VLECDDDASDHAIDAIERLEWVRWARRLDKVGG